MRLRLLITAAILSVAAIGASAAIAQPTSAAWTDGVMVSATVKAGTWSAPQPPAISCAPVNPAVTATCTATATGWDDWGSGYRLAFKVTTTSTTPFEWVVTLNLAATGTPAPGGGTLFPGWPVPAGGWYSAWTPTGFSATNLCTVSTQSALPALKLKGDAAWAQMVSAGQQVTALGIQTTNSGGSTVGSLAC
jgi:predicted ribosomally synthesized peptide with SipW-like signal peptide